MAHMQKDAKRKKEELSHTEKGDSKAALNEHM